MVLMRAAAAGVLLVLVCCAAARAEAEQPAQEPDEATVETEEVITYQSPTVNPKKVYFAEHFDNENTLNKRWVVSEAKKDGVDDDIAKYKGTWEIKEPEKRLLKNDRGLVLTSEATHAAVAAPLDRVFQFTDKPLIVQYEVTLQDGQNCGGAYLKLLSLEPGRPSDRASLRQFTDRSPYTIMFGPDKCGSDNKLHFIFRHRNPKNGTVEEKHCKKPKERIDDYLKDKQPHLYTLVVRPDNTFSVSVDGKEVNSGSLLEDFTPPVNPPDMVDDPTDTKPADWDEREMIPEPDAVKPADWDESAPAQVPDPHAVKPDGWLDDEPLTIPDTSAVKPADWDEEMDGTWEPPQVDNPACSAAPGCGPWTPPTINNPDYKGPWRPQLVANPNYRGKWSPRRIPNPHYFKDDHPFRMTPIYAVGFELWSISPNMLFDNLLITDDPDAAAHWTAQTFTLKQQLISANSESVVGRAWGWLLERPWVVVLSALVLLAAIGYLLYWLCSEDEKAEDKKKTDGYTADEMEEDGEVEGEEGEGEGGRGGDDLLGEGEGGEDDVTDTPPEEPPAADSTSGTGLVDAEGGGDGHRKRRARRE